MSEASRNPLAQPSLLAVLSFVFAGGALGSAARELLVPLLPSPWFWVPVLLINLLASFLVGWLYALRDRVSRGLTHFLVGGFCGGFSTFSHFTYELVTLGDLAAWLEAGAYLTLAVVLGITAAVAGEAVAERLHGVEPHNE